MLYDHFTGWNPEQEERDFEIFSDKCRGSVLSWSDVEAQVVAEAASPMTVSIRQAVETLYAEGRSSYMEYVYGNQETNDCGSWGTGNATDLTQVYQTYRGVESKVYRTFKPWIYGVGKCLVGDHYDNGMSISLAMQHIATHGVLPADLPGLPKYSGSLQKQLLRNCTDFYNTWKDHAVAHDVVVVKLPMNFEAWQLWAKTGRWIVYGTTQKTLIKNGVVYEAGRTSHCEACGGNVELATGSITKVSSWGDGSGWMSPSVTKKVIAGGTRYGSAFGIWGFTRRECAPDYSGLGRTS